MTKHPTTLIDCVTRPIVIEETLGIDYERVLVPVRCGRSRMLRDRISGRIYAVQSAPALPIDRSPVSSIDVIAADLRPHERLELEPVSSEAPSPSPITVMQEGTRTIIRNGRRAVALPADGLVDPPFPGPIESFQVDGGPWWGEMSLVGASQRGTVWTHIESLGPACVQWRTSYRWEDGGGCDWRVRWAVDADTLVVVEEGLQDTEAVVEWTPFSDEPAQALVRGGGERLDAMRPLQWKGLPEARRSPGRRELQRIGHIGYFHQWTLGWVGFAANDDRFVGLFSGWGGRWVRRGAGHLRVVEDDQRGHLVRMPIRRCVRAWGLVLGTRAESGLDVAGRPHVLNRRKLQWSDVPVDKVADWVLDPPLDSRRANLLDDGDLSAARQRLSGNPEVVQALQRWTDQLPADHHAHVAAAFVRRDGGAMARAMEAIALWADQTVKDLRLGGYERMNIFRGRIAKRHAFSLDVAWAMGEVEAWVYRRIRRALLLLAYVFSDPDFCIYEDYWPQLSDADNEVASALRETMGNCPTPPNFASEFFTTVAVIAELFPGHPRSGGWRSWGMDQLDRFLKAFVESDGTYLESINYHVHLLNQLLCQAYPLWRKGVRDYFAHPAIRGGFEHLCQLQLPSLPCGGDGQAKAGRSLHLDAGPRRVALPGDGNSGNHGRPQAYKGELSVAAWVYRESHPMLSAHLMDVWRASGRMILDAEHPMLTLLTLDPSLTSSPVPWQSAWRRSLGVVSKARTNDGLPLWCLFRAGRATNHMDFDQGNIHLVLGDRVLLGDHGYHTCDSKRRPMHAAATWLHNTLTYAADRNLSSGYTGLEEAPEPVKIHVGEAFDWAVHRIVNTNYRDLQRLTYRDLIPARRTVHLRHYLLVKPDYLLIWDVLEEAHEAATLWLHPSAPMEQVGVGRFRSGRLGSPHLAVQFVRPRSPRVVENRRMGPLWSFGVQQPVGKGFLTLLVPQVHERSILAELEGRSTVRVRGQGVSDRIELPPAGSEDCLPRLIRSGDQNETAAPEHPAHNDRSTALRHVRPEQTVIHADAAL